MATPVAAVGQAVGEVLAPLVIEFGGDGVKLWGKKVTRKRGMTDNRATIKRLEIPSPIYLALLGLAVASLPGKDAGVDAWEVYLAANPVLNAVFRLMGK